MMMNNDEDERTERNTMTSSRLHPSFHPYVCRGSEASGRGGVAMAMCEASPPPGPSSAAGLHHRRGTVFWFWTRGSGDIRLLSRPDSGVAAAASLPGRIALDGVLIIWLEPGNRWALGGRGHICTPAGRWRGMRREGWSTGSGGKETGTNSSHLQIPRQRAARGRRAAPGAATEKQTPVNYQL